MRRARTAGARTFMSGIVGILDFQNRPVATAEVERMAAPLRRRGQPRLLAHPGACVGHLGQHGAGPPVRGGVCADPASGLLVLADSRLYDTAGLAAELGQPAGVSEAALVFAAVARWGPAAVERLVGEFVLVAWDARERRAWCARDPMGVRTLFVHRAGARLAFATEIKGILAATTTRPAVNLRRVAAHLALDLGEGEDTFFEGVARIPAGHRVEFSAAGPPSAHRYWDPASRPRRRAPEAESWAAELRDRFETAVAERLPSDGSDIASFLSGGLDSSSIVCMARRHGVGVDAFTAIFPGLTGRERRRTDESRFVAAVVERSGARSQLVPMNESSPLADLEQVVATLDEPHLAPNLYMHWAIYERARAQGHRTILDGLDGDSVVSHGLDALALYARRLQWRKLLREARALARTRPARSWSVQAILRQIVLPSLVPAPLRMLKGALVGPAPEWRRWLELLSPELRRAGGIEQRMRRREFTSGAGLSLRRAHAERLQGGLLQYALDGADKCAAALGLEPRYPFFDRRLIELCLDLPPAEKLRGGVPRAVFREAMEDVLPPSVQWRMDKADLSPGFLHGLVERDRGRLESLLVDQVDRLAPFVQVDVLRERLRGLLERGDRRDAYQLFAAATLAEWLRQREEANSRSPATASSARNA